MATQNKTDIGLIGLAVMGENLALNMESRGWSVSVYNRTVPGVEEGVVERFINGRAKGKHIEGFTDIEAFVESIALPRKIMMMVRAGSPVDELMEQLFPYLSPGDILIDGGNSNYEDTNRRVKLAESKGFLFVGAGVSGGEEGALNGASIMPGGSEKAWEEVKPILQSIAAQAPDGTPCCQWVGPAGSGHFVKMIHNGIEYGDMQLIAEAYWVMKELLDMTNEEMASVFTRWNEGKLRSYLIEITGNILRHKDKTGAYLIDKILDAAGQKGTGKWSVINAMELGMPLGLIATAVLNAVCRPGRNCVKLLPGNINAGTQWLYIINKIRKKRFSRHCMLRNWFRMLKGLRCCNVLPIHLDGTSIWLRLHGCGEAVVLFAVFS